MYTSISFTNNGRFVSSFPTFLLFTSCSCFTALLGLPVLKGDGDSKHPYLFPNLREKTIDVFIDTVYRIKEVPSSFHRLGSSTDCCDVSCSWLPPTWPAAPCHSPLLGPPLLPDQQMLAHLRSLNLFSNYPQCQDDLILPHYSVSQLLGLRLQSWPLPKLQTCKYSSLQCIHVQIPKRQLS